MAHALPHARSILCLNATRVSNGRLHSNFPWSYEQCTIPRHLRDIVVTEYGIADLRGKTDREVVESLIAVMDARFQGEFIRAAKRAGKLPKDYRAPESARVNTPEHLSLRYATWTQRGFFPRLPFDSDLTAEEADLTQALKHLQQESSGVFGRVRVLLRAMRSSGSPNRYAAHLKRMELADPQTLNEKLQQRLVILALEELRGSRATQ
jgi:hypothetical protein